MAKKALLMILDGWGIGKHGKGDVIFNTPTPYLDYLQAVSSHSQLNASGEDVGLPDGQMGNSEVGHLNIGAGRIVYQDLVKINRACADGSISQNPQVKEAYEYAKQTGKKLHLMGLTSNGGVHSSLDHLFKLIEVGKEYGLSQQLFDTPETLIRLDMSEFMEKHSVSKIIGSPPGYVGYDEAGQVTEKVRRRPYSVLLFDEIEKAHPDVLNILLQILDEGKVTDAHGRAVNFENTVIVMTSNAGSGTKESALGFGKTMEDASKEKVMKALSDFLRPEFIARVDEVIVFNNLKSEDYVKIAGLMLAEYVSTLEEKHISFTYDDKACEYLAEKSCGGKSGARDLRNTIRREVEEKIAEAMISSENGSLSSIHVTFKINFNCKKIFKGRLLPAFFAL